MRGFLRLVSGAVLVCVAVSAHAQPVDPTKPAPPATPPPASTPPAPVKPAGSGDAQYDSRLREIEERVVDIKERIFKTKTRLQLLKEQILNNVVAESRSVLVHRNEMGSYFTLESVIYYLDGKKIYFQDNKNGVLDDRREFEIYNGTIIPGNHALSVELVYKGNSRLFSYLEGYVFKLKSSYTFYAAKGRVTKVIVVGFERGGLDTDLEDKPYVKYEIQQQENKNAPKDADKSSGDKAGESVPAEGK